MNLSSIPRSVYLLLVWLCSWFVVSKYLGFGAVYFAVSGIAFIFANLGKKQQGDLSAYAVFNQDCAALPGTMNADQIDANIRHRPAGPSRRFAMPQQTTAAADVPFDMEIAAALADPRSNLSKIANQPCLCGSERKTKKCCGSAAAIQAVEDERRREERRQRKFERQYQ